MNKLLIALLILLPLSNQLQAAEPEPAAPPQTWRAGGRMLPARPHRPRLPPQTWAAQSKIMGEQFATNLLDSETYALENSWRYWATDYFERFILASARPYLRQWQEAWSKADRIELHSLSEVRDDKLPRLREYYTLVGTAVITDPAELAQLEALLPVLIAEGDNSYQIRAGCFQPHHGLSILVGKQQHDIVICFTCENAAVYSETLPRGEQQIQYSNEEQHKMVDQILAKHKVRSSVIYEAEQLELRRWRQELIERLIEENKKYNSK